MTIVEQLDPTVPMTAACSALGLEQARFALCSRIKIEKPPITQAVSPKTA